MDGGNMYANKFMCNSKLLLGDWQNVERLRTILDGAKVLFEDSDVVSKAPSIRQAKPENPLRKCHSTSKGGNGLSLKHNRPRQGDRRRDQAKKPLAGKIYDATSTGREEEV